MTRDTWPPELAESRGKTRNARCAINLCNEPLGWLQTFGPVTRVGVEGLGSYGAGARVLRAAGLAGVDVDRPNRQARRRQRSRPLDAVEAARPAQSGRALGVAKTRDGNVEAMRALMVVKRWPVRPA